MFGGFSSAQDANTDELRSCSIPDFDRTQDTGIYVWQVCSTKQWFFRVSAGGLPADSELRVIGELKLSKPIASLTPFSLNTENDLLDGSDPENIKFNLRVFVAAQDGFEFELQDDTVACLQLSTSIDAPIIIGGENIEVSSPVNINTVDNTICIAPLLVPNVMMLLDEEQQ